MENDIESTHINPNYAVGKVFTERQIQIGTFLGGPLVAGYLFAKNYKLFGNDKKAMFSWLIAVGSFVAIIAIGFFFSSDSKLGNSLIPIITTAIISGIYRIEMLTLVEDHIEQGGEKESWGKTILAVIISVVIVIISAIGFFTFFPDEEVIDSPYTKKVYGTQKHEIYFEESNITEKEVDQLAYALTKAEHFSDDLQTFVLVEKEGDVIIMSLTYNYPTLDSESLQYAAWLRSEVAFSIRPNKFKIKILDKNNNLLKTIE